MRKFLSDVMDISIYNKTILHDEYCGIDVFHAKVLVIYNDGTCEEFWGHCCFDEYFPSYYIASNNGVVGCGEVIFVDEDDEGRVEYTWHGLDYDCALALLSGDVQGVIDSCK